MFSTSNVTGLGTTRILEAIRHRGITTKFYQASSSELFGSAPAPQNEQTPFQPRSPYPIAKLYSYSLTLNYRDAYNMFACNGILFNHESPRRGEIFVTRKITRAIAHILAGDQKHLYLGNIDAKRDWGFAPEYVEMMWLMLQQDTPDDYVVGTGKTHSVRDFINVALDYLGIELEWKGEGTKETGVVKSVDRKWNNILQTGQTIILIDPKYFRPTEVDILCADISKAKEKPHWEPKVNFNDLVKLMINHDLEKVNVPSPGLGMNILEQNGYDWTNHKISLHELIKE
jgi:GDPmannose 4,6-dehydratase